MAIGKKEAEGVSLPPSDAPVDRAHAFANPPVGPGGVTVKADDSPPPASPPAQPAEKKEPEIIRANPRADVFEHPSPEQAKQEAERAKAANEAAGVSASASSGKQGSTEDRIARLERILRSQGHDV